MVGGYILNNLERPDPGTLRARSADKETTVARRGEQNRTGGGQIGPGIKIARDPDRVAQDGLIDIIAGFDVDATHQLHDPAGFGLIVGAGLVEVFANEIEQFSNFRALQLRES